MKPAETGRHGPPRGRLSPAFGPPVTSTLGLTDLVEVHQQMKAIDDAVRALRDNDHVIAASLLASWKGSLTFIGLVAVAFLYRHDQQTIVAFGKLGIALVGLAGWTTDAFFIRRRWRREAGRAGERDDA